MSRRWTADEDAFIHAYFGAVMVNSIANDLGRTMKAIGDRAQKLRECGAWEALDRLHKAERDYFIALGADEMDADIATIRRVPVSSQNQTGAK